LILNGYCFCSIKLPHARQAIYIRIQPSSAAAQKLIVDETTIQQKDVTQPPALRILLWPIWHQAYHSLLDQTAGDVRRQRHIIDPKQAHRLPMPSNINDKGGPVDDPTHQTGLTLIVWQTGQQINRR
jgi:hypothetical protein